LAGADGCFLVFICRILERVLHLQADRWQYLVDQKLSHSNPCAQVRLHIPHLDLPQPIHVADGLQVSALNAYQEPKRVCLLNDPEQVLFQIDGWRWPGSCNRHGTLFGVHD